MTLLDRRRIVFFFGAGWLGAQAARRAEADGDTPSTARLGSQERAALEDFLRERRGTRLWSGSPRAEERLRALRATLEDAEQEGLDPRDYDPDRLAELRADPDRLERAATAALLAFARDLRLGRPLPRLPSRPAAREETPRALLEQAAAAPDLALWLAGLAPVTPRYARLRGLLAELRAVATRGGWTPLPPIERKLEPGDRHPAIPALRRRLAETDGFPGPLEGEELDPPLVAALRRFQLRHGLEPDGVLGKRTTAALAAPVSWRIAQVILAMERLRRLPPERGPRWILVDIAGFRLEFVEEPEPGEERVLLESPIIVGTRFTQTPELTARARAVTLNPYWYVPRSIAVKEILPDVQKDPGWLERNEMVVFDREGRRVDPASVPWGELGPGRFPYRFRQDWGPKNPLGRIKLEMPNPFDVFLHDTPKRELFARTVRTFSHGCIRVARMHELAEFLLAEQGWDRARIEAAIEAGGVRSIPLRTQPLAHVTYLGAAVDPDGTVRFRDDVYGRDARLAAALGLAAPASP
ncbi:MAG: L,D-transpeptidase family protein [Geminicoccaceae bacterium]|nr:L,D-transpeptidase family protein [Geminicoccaceae bacterium]